MLLGLLNSSTERLVMRAAAYGALNLIRGISGGAEPSSEQVGCDTKHGSGCADDGRFELRHVPIAAAVAVKLELVSPIRRKIIVIMNKLN
jgi:hypothetical protein